MKIDLKDKKTLKITAVLGAIVLALLVSIIVFLGNGFGKRRIFVFPSVDEGDYVVEARYMKKNPTKDDVSYYIAELLLGPDSERTKSLFTSGTRVLSCFEKDGILYVNLSEDLLNLGDNVVPFDEGFELLVKNIKQNFSKIKSVEIYVNGIAVSKN